jgi:hypothetical protein
VAGVAVFLYNCQRGDMFSSHATLVYINKPTVLVKVNEQRRYILM